MSAIREIRNCLVVDLDCYDSKQRRKKDFFGSFALPSSFLASEPHADAVATLWTNFTHQVNDCCKNRYSWQWCSNPHRTIVFQAQMENLCHDFSRRTETIKVRFLMLQHQQQQQQVQPSAKNKNKNNSRQKTRYQLQIMQLTDIPESSRNVQFCVAEIPPMPVPEAHAELVLIDSPPQLQVLTTGDSTCTLPAASQVQRVSEEEEQEESEMQQDTVIMAYATITTPIYNHNDTMSYMYGYGQRHRQAPIMALAVPEYDIATTPMVASQQAQQQPWQQPLQILPVVLLD
jgi:hypothetical protein